MIVLKSQVSLNKLRDFINIENKKLYKNVIILYLLNLFFFFLY